MKGSESPMGIIIWVFSTAISFLLLYAVIRGAINHSNIAKQDGEVSAMNAQLNRNHQEMMRQMEDLTKIIAEQNLILSEIKISKKDETEI
ncbi:hypothetical protein J2T12_002879 [Paenibacillus anaericanus]|uniref:Uncharacterized protein n=2 Tax=Paenibacillus anaericanus TaxID=170367 RepID=A0A433Y750_9BACL|nr:hypothetical protein [Paenibacillus anaericanus]RUT45201.1 hypothetical protein EJP82_16100 [Paenibacillus anaericanus]